MDRQNVTLSLPKALLKRAKVFAAGEEKSLSRLIRESLEDKIRSFSGFRKAGERQTRLLRSGLDLGTNGRLAHDRDSLHAR